MSLFTTRHPRRAMLVAALTAGVFLGGPLAAHIAHAAVGCRSDPAVFLSNGVKVQLSAAIATDASDVRRIVYTLHIPSGVAVTRVVFTAGGLDGREQLTVQADDAARNYDTTTVVYTRLHGVAVTAFTQVVNPTTYANSAPQEVTGQDQQSLATHAAA